VLEQVEPAPAVSIYTVAVPSPCCPHMRAYYGKRSIQGILPSRVSVADDWDVSGPCPDTRRLRGATASVPWHVDELVCAPFEILLLLKATTSYVHISYRTRYIIGRPSILIVVVCEQDPSLETTTALERCIHTHCNMP